MITATRYHDFSAGHRVVGHEGKCRNLHGHNYRVHFTCGPGAGGLDGVGRVLDFSVMKAKLCDWLEEQLDHRFLVYVLDPLREEICKLDATAVVVPFNPTAENLAQHLLEVVGPSQLHGTGVVLLSVEIEETRKCSARAG